MSFYNSWGPSEISKETKQIEIRTLPAKRDLVLEDVETGWVGAIVSCEKSGGKYIVNLENAHKKIRSFPLGFGFLYEGEPVKLIPYVQVAPAKTKISVSGGKLAPKQKAKVAKASRIWVEGKHDAQLIEKIWGDDLRDLGIVVESLNGVDCLEEMVLKFAPNRNQKLGILVDHLVPRSKEEKIVNQTLSHAQFRPFVCILGHPYVDIWQAIKPNTLGFQAWPEISLGLPWKESVLKHLGLPCATKTDVALAWQHFLAKVNKYSDLEHYLLRSMENIVDFLTEPDRIL